MENAVLAGLEILSNRLKSIFLQVAVILMSLSLVTQVGLIRYFKDITLLQAGALSFIISSVIGFASISIETFKGKLSVKNPDWKQSLALSTIAAALGGPIFLVFLILYNCNKNLQTNAFIYLLEWTSYYLFVGVMLVSIGALIYGVYKRKRRNRPSHNE